MKSKIIAVVQIAILLVAIVLLATVLKPCTGEMTMKCNYSVAVVKLLFVTIILIKGIELFSSETIHGYFDAITIVLLADSILVPAWIVGGCKMADMACQARSFPGIYVIAGVLIILNAIQLLLQITKRQKDVVG